MEKEILVTVQFHSGQSETSAIQLAETFTPGMKLNLFQKMLQGALSPEDQESDHKTHCSHSNSKVAIIQLYNSDILL